MGEINTEPCVLVVADNKEIRSAIVHLLKINDYRVVEAATAQEAIAPARQERLDLILVDFNSTLRDGLAAARDIRECTTRNNLPMVVIYFDDQDDTRTGELAASSDEHVVRVIDLDQLINILSRILHGYPNAA